MLVTKAEDLTNECKAAMTNKEPVVMAGEERERNPRNSRWAGTGTRERNGRGRGGDAVEGQGPAGDATFRDSDGGATRADLAR
jgi:hypothetical protein